MGVLAFVWSFSGHSTGGRVAELGSLEGEQGRVYRGHFPSLTGAES